MKRNQHIVPHRDGWAVKGEGAERAPSVHRTQQAAIERGRELARQSKIEVFVHGRDGRIRERDSHGRDPFPPRG